MKKIFLAALISSFAFAGGAQAQDMSQGIRESTDPAKVADVERRASELQARQQSADQQSGASGESGMKSKKKHNKHKRHSNRSSGTSDDGQTGR
jgi:hypothetical protein